MAEDDDKSLDLNKIRGEIDEVDAQLVKLLEKRLELTRSVARYKLATGKKVLDRSRENQKISVLESSVGSVENTADIVRMFRQIMADSRKYQYRLLEMSGNTAREPFTQVDEIKKTGVTVVYQGVPGAYSDIAMEQVFGRNVKNFNVRTWRMAMEAVRDGKADYAVLPVENSTTGFITDVFDLLEEFQNYIIGETYVKVEHVLCGLPGAALDGIRKVYSHPQGIMQCSRFLDSHPDWKLSQELNTAASAKKVADEGDISQAAIASRQAAKSYGLTILKEGISDIADNETRFLIVENKRCFVKQADKMCILFETPNEPGSLYAILSHIVYNGLNMSWLESRPIRNSPREFRFFVEFDGNINDPEVIDAMRGIQEESRSVRLLGNYRSEK
ncbi:MAG: bifunctional chorismate mutase/prephenate dehydratase [Lachnospiraceae bacterium]|jgi:chorismate mutase/prephenate dehydratase